MKVTWLPVPGHETLRGRYELYNGEELEYVGQDLMYIAKRLHPETEYMFRLRVCSWIPGDCSYFSIPRFQQTSKGMVADDSIRLFIGANSVPLSTFSAFMLVAITAFIVWKFISYVVSFFNDINKSLDILPKTITAGIDSDQLKDFVAIKSETNDLATYLGYKHKSIPSKNTEPSITSSAKNSKTVEKKTESGRRHITKNKSVDNTFTSTDEEDFKLTETEGVSDKSKGCKCKDNIEVKKDNGSHTKHCYSPPSRHKRKRSRKRSKTYSSASQNNRNTDTHETNYSDSTDCHESSYSDSEMYKNNLRDVITVRQAITQADSFSNIVVMIDNSNIFIGARETVCHANPRVRPKQVKLRLHQFIHVIEDGRKVSRGITGGSSPPTKEHIWDIYRRLGYTVDLEDRRGKDEQRVDEQLHLAIFKALVELPVQTLVLATGDGHRGKSKGDTSFIDCAKKAIEFGWKVEVFSWRHCLSAEWLKLASHYNRDFINIKYLDEHLDKVTLVKRKQARKSL